MSAPKAEIALTTDVDADVIAGLRLYRDYAAPTVGNDIIQKDWVRWVSGSDSGKGLSAIAKIGGKVIGYYAMLPTTMWIGGEEVCGAKGEFHVVAPEYRKTIADSGMPVPFALVATAKKNAARFGIDSTFGRTTKSAFITRATGGKPFSFAIDDFITVLTRDALFRKTSHMKSTLAWIGTSSFRTITAYSRLGSSRYVREIDRFEQENLVPPGAANRLVAPTAVTLNFRFPTERYVKYLTTDRAGRPAYFIFTRPRTQTPMQLMDWSSFDIPSRHFAGIIHRVFAAARAANACLIRGSVPATWNARRLLRKHGFIRVHREATVYITCNTPELEKARDDGSWEFTNAHSGYYDAGTEEGV